MIDVGTAMALLAKLVEADEQIHSPTRSERGRMRWIGRRDGYLTAMALILGLDEDETRHVWQSGELSMTLLDAR